MNILSRKISLNPKYAAVLLPLLCAALYAISLTKESFIPSNFFLDAETIRQNIAYGGVITTEDSFESVAAIYKFLGITEVSLRAISLQFAIVFCAIYSVIFGRRFSATVGGYAVAAFFIFSALVYLTTLSKDFFALAVMMVYPIATRRHFRVRFFLWLTIAVLYAVFLRKYWFIFLGCFLILYWLFSVKSYTLNLRNIAITCALIYLGLFFAFDIGMGLDLNNFRAIINDTRLENADLDARTAINEIIEGDGIMSFLNIILVWISLLIPWPLVLLGGLYYSIIAFIIALFFCVFLLEKLFARVFMTRAVRDSVLLLIAFTMTQALFEPDYGSYLRHLTALFPFILILINEEA